MRAHCSQFVMAAFAVFLLGASALGVQDRFISLVPDQPAYQSATTEYRPPGGRRIAAASPRAYAHFTGNLTHSVFDDDGDGWYDRLRPTAEVQVSEEGRSLFTADVMKGADEWITSRQDWRSVNLLSPLDTFLSVGTHYLPLSFSGEDIYRSGYDGPYNVRWLLRCEGGPDTITQVTAAYNHTMFGELPARIQGFTDAGLDTDGDGLYDTLRCSVSILLSQKGDYHINAWMTVGDTLMVALGSSIMDSAGPGVVVFPVDFPGPMIWEHRLDGPYNVRLWVHHDKGFVEQSGFATGPYSYTDFDPPDVRLNGLPTVTPLDLGAGCLTACGGERFAGDPPHSGRAFLLPRIPIALRAARRSARPRSSLS